MTYLERNVCLLSACPSLGWMLDAGLVTLFILAELAPCTKGRSLSVRDGVSKQKERDFFSGSHHLDTLMWAVQLDAQSLTSQQLMAVASQVAMETGLVNMGQLGILKGLYLFVHDLHNVSYKFHGLERGEHKSRPSAKILTPSEMEAMKRSNRKHRVEATSNLSNTQRHGGSDRLTVEAWETVRDRVHQKLNMHRHVKWHLQEMVRPRHVRSLDFEDPSFPQQWHLVSSSGTNPVLLSTFCNISF